MTLILVATVVDVSELGCSVIGCVYRLRQRRHCEEQRRRNGKRSRSGGHDTIYHCASKTHALATQAERGVSVRFICVIGATRRRKVRLFRARQHRLAGFDTDRASS